MPSEVSDQRRGPIGWLIPALIVVLAVVLLGPIGSFAVGVALVVWSLRLGRPERFIVIGLGLVLAIWPVISMADYLLGRDMLNVA